MKIKTEHLEHIRKKIEIVLQKNPKRIEDYEHGRFDLSDRVKDLQERFNFDLLYAAGLNAWVVQTIYDYADDNHLATALKKICPRVERKY